MLFRTLFGCKHQHSADRSRGKRSNGISRRLKGYMVRREELRLSNGPREGGKKGSEDSESTAASADCPRSAVKLSKEMETKAATSGHTESSRIGSEWPTQQWRYTSDKPLAVISKNKPKQQSTKSKKTDDDSREVWMRAIMEHQEKQTSHEAQPAKKGQLAKKWQPAKK